MTSTALRVAPPVFRFPGGSDRTVIIGPTGSGKTVAGAWLLSRQRFDRRPWVALDFKGEEFWDLVGDPPMRPLRLGKLPAKTGLYRLQVHPGQEDELESWLWQVWRHENIGLFCDEVSLIPQRHAFKAVLRQGRSKLIPVISCTQRPVDCEREVFTESQFRMCFGVEDDRDYPIVRGLFREQDIRQPLPERWSYWYDARARTGLTLKPVPPPDTIAASLRQAVPYSWFLGR